MNLSMPDLRTLYEFMHLFFCMRDRLSSKFSCFLKFHMYQLLSSTRYQGMRILYEFMHLYNFPEWVKELQIQYTYHEFAIYRYMNDSFLLLTFKEITHILVGLCWWMYRKSPKFWDLRLSILYLTKICEESVYDRGDT